VATKLLVAKSPWPVALIASKWGRNVYERECGPFETLAASVARIYNDDDLEAPISSGSVLTGGRHGHPEQYVTERRPKTITNCSQNPKTPNFSNKIMLDEY
jgi:hypothetical protein